MNTILKTKEHQIISDLAKQEINYPKNIVGIAVKLSTLEENEIMFSQIVQNTQCLLLVDAEFDRLDIWLQEQMKVNEISELDKSRIILTVQARREDAYSQLMNLKKMNIRVLLVIGHSTYLTMKERSKNGLDAIRDLYQRFNNIQYLGINEKEMKILNSEYGLKIHREALIELYNQKRNRKGSTLWVLFSDDQELSLEAKNYIQRRDKINNRSEHIIETRRELIELLEVSKLFLFIDILSKLNFFEIIEDFNL